MGINAAQGGVISSAIGAIGGLIGNSQEFAQKKKLMALENKYNTEQWERQTAYNSPANQRSLLMKGQLNPDLFYANGASQSLADAPAPSGHYDAPAAPDYGRLMQQGFDSALQIPVLKSQAAAQAAAASNSDSEARLKRIDAMTRLDENIARLAEAKSNAKTSEAKARYADLLESAELERRNLVNAGVESDNKGKEISNDIKAEERKQAVLQTLTAAIEAKYKDKRLAAEVKEITARTASVLASTQLTEAQYQRVMNEIAMDAPGLLEASNDKKLREWFNKHCGEEVTSILYGTKDLIDNLLVAVGGFFLGKAKGAKIPRPRQQFDKYTVNGNTIDWSN